MARKWQVALGAIVAAIVLWIVIPGWVFSAIVLAAIVIPVAGYLMLDKSQRRRLRGIRQRKQIGR